MGCTEKTWVVQVILGDTWSSKRALATAGGAFDLAGHHAMRGAFVRLREDMQVDVEMRTDSCQMRSHSTEHEVPFTPMVRTVSRQRRSSR